MKIFIRELIRSAALIYLLVAPWAIVSGRVQGLGTVLVLAGLLPTCNHVLAALRRELESTPLIEWEDVTVPRPEEPAAVPRLRLVPAEPRRSAEGEG